MIIDGKQIQKELIEELKKERGKFDKLRLVAFLIGEDKEKESFLKIKEKIAKELNVDFRLYKIDENISRKKLRKYINQIVKSDLVNGAIIQLPLLRGQELHLRLGLMRPAWYYSTTPR
jgi:methylenetetrahydrofolate dehydrogenase (NADP+)/methenyltetrahydrofolate cyclohydrolase